MVAPDIVFCFLISPDRCSKWQSSHHHTTHEHNATTKNRAPLN